MAYSFTVDNWADEIAEVSTQPEFQRAVIRIFDKSQATLVTPYNIETGIGPIYTGGDLYPLGDEDGRARIIGVRWGVQSGGGVPGQRYDYFCHPSTDSSARRGSCQEGVQGLCGIGPQPCPTVVHLHRDFRHAGV